MFAASFPTSFGRCAITWNNTALTSFHLPGAYADANTETVPPAWVATIITRVQNHFDGKLQDFADLKYDFSRVTPFQKIVYEAALAVKPGDVRTYGWLAAATGSPASASRAVGTALGRNPWPLLVPCHRFIGADGKLTGFSAPGGIATKERLLALEKAVLPLVYSTP
ncbi:MAG: methylated-DNA--[protein]-cysteine S-methyltransferase [Nibricoccus sp.]